MSVIRIDKKGALEGRHTLTGRALAALLSWRPRPGEAVTVADPEGALFRARVLALGDKGAELAIFEPFGRLEDAGPEITLLQALPDKERMELIIQKTTELGVAAIIPFASSRSVTMEEREARQKKAHRWPEVALKAARQSRRATIPAVSVCLEFKEALDAAQGAELKLALWERPGIARLKEALKADERAKSVAILSGPEGGMEEAEILEAKGRGFLPVTLGQNILRAETAPIAAVAIIMHVLGV